MYKLLIVDDEFQARNGLRDLVDWQSLGICVVGDAEDGDVALEMLRSQKPDILLTDVRMNRVDGLTLAREARRCLPGIEIVFISGYSDADYLRDALRVEAFDYLYKPVRLAELNGLMRRLTQRLAERAEANLKMERARLLLEKSRPLLVERFVNSWIRGMIQDMQTVNARLELLDIAISKDSGLVAAAFQPEWPAFPSDGQAEGYLVVLEDAVRERIPAALICAEETGLIALIPCAKGVGQEALLEDFAAISNKMRGVTDAMLLIGVSTRRADWADVHDAVREAQQTIERRLSPDGHTILTYEEEAEADAAGADIFDDSLIERHLITGSFDALWSGIEEMLSGLESTARDADRARKLLLCCALRADLALERKGLSGIDALTFCRHALAHRPLSSVKGALRTSLEEACARVLDQREGAYSATVGQVLEIIRTRYAQRLSVDAVAEEVHYSPAHLSTLFRQETGVTIGEALYKTRLLAAMDMLRATRDPVSAIAQRAGYTDVQYFSRVFKRYTGITPLEYRKRSQPC